MCYKDVLKFAMMYKALNGFAPNYLKENSLMFPKDIKTLRRTWTSIWYYSDPIHNTEINALVIVSRGVLWKSIPEGGREICAVLE